MFYLQFGAGINVPSHPDIPKYKKRYHSCVIGTLNHLLLTPVGLFMLDKNLTNLDTHLFPHVPSNSVIDCKLPHPWVSSSGDQFDFPPSSLQLKEV